MSDKKKQSIMWILADQLSAAALPVYGGCNIETPNIQKLAGESIVFDRAYSTCPVCSPYRSMLLTGRYPQTTGHVINFIKTRHDETTWADVFGKAGYRCGWIGKWHLHTGSFPTIPDARDFVPEGRDRLGFDYFRAYNFHMKYFNGSVATEKWQCENWEGYETKGILKYVDEFLDTSGESPFCLFLSVHQPHFTPFKFAPEKYYEDLPETFPLPPNVPDDRKEEANDMLRHYLAMTRAVDEMVGDIMKTLEDRGLLENTTVVFTSDHGSQCGAQGLRPWAKSCPFEESIRIPFILRWPGVMAGGTRSGSLFGAQDLLPTFADLFGIPIPDSVEGISHAKQWLGQSPIDSEPAQLLMNFSSLDYPIDVNEWRGIRTHNHMYYRTIHGYEGLYDVGSDPYEMNNLVTDENSKDLLEYMRNELQRQLMRLNDEFLPGSQFEAWFDEQRRVVRNSHGLLSHPESRKAESKKEK